MCLEGRFYQFSLAAVDVYTARERARCGDRDRAIPQMRAATDDLFNAGQHSYGIPATGLLVETLLDRGAESDVAEAEAAIDRLAADPADEGLVIRDVWRGCGRCWRAPMATTPAIATIGIATARWPQSWASRGT